MINEIVFRLMYCLKWCGAAVENTMRIKPLICDRWFFYCWSSKKSFWLLQRSFHSFKHKNKGLVDIRFCSIEAELQPTVRKRFSAENTESSVPVFKPF